MVMLMVIMMVMVVVVAIMMVPDCRIIMMTMAQQRVSALIAPEPVGSTAAPTGPMVLVSKSS